MSRFTGHDDDEDFPGQWELYQSSLRQALRGKRGQRFLRELREALLALPAPRLIEGAMCTVGAAARRADLVAAAEAEYAAGVTAREGDAEHRFTPEPFLDLSLVEEFDRKVAAEGESVCAGGAYLWYRKVRDGMDPGEAFAALPMLLGVYDEDGERSDQVTADMLAEAGRVARSVAWEIGSVNDESFARETPEQRHAAFLAWIDRELVAEAVTS